MRDAWRLITNSQSPSLLERDYLYEEPTHREHSTVASASPHTVNRNPLPSWLARALVRLGSEKAFIVSQGVSHYIYCPYQSNFRRREHFTAVPFQIKNFRIGDLAQSRKMFQSHTKIICRIFYIDDYSVKALNMMSCTRIRDWIKLSLCWQCCPRIRLELVKVFCGLPCFCPSNFSINPRKSMK